MTNKCTPRMMEERLPHDGLRKPCSSQVRVTRSTSRLLACATFCWLGMTAIASAQDLADCPDGTVTETYLDESNIVLEVAGPNRIVPIEVTANVFDSKDVFSLISIPSEDGTKLFISNTYPLYLKAGYNVAVESTSGVQLCKVKKDDLTLVPGSLVDPQAAPGGGGGGGGGLVAGGGFLPGGGNGEGLFPIGYTGYTPCGTPTIFDAQGNPVDQINLYGECDPFGSPWPVYDFSDNPWFGFDFASMFIH